MRRLETPVAGPQTAPHRCGTGYHNCQQYRSGRDSGELIKGCRGLQVLPDDAVVEDEAADVKDDCPPG